MVLVCSQIGPYSSSTRQIERFCEVSCGGTGYEIAEMNCGAGKRADVLTEYLEAIKNTVSYKHWIFGHYHDDRVIDDKETLVYRKMIRI